MRPAIYIPTHNRPEFAYQIVRQCNEFMPDIPIFLTMDESQYNAQFRSAFFGDCGLLLLGIEGKQIGYARQHAIEHAHHYGYSHILMLDDDVKLTKSIGTIFKNFEEHPDCAWIGSYFSFYSIANIKPDTGFHYTYSLGYMAVALDVQKVLEVGNYDAAFHTHEDQDLAIRLMEAGHSQGIDSNIKCSFKNTTMSGEGGCSSWDYPANELLMHEKLIEKHGPFFGLRKGKCFTQWTKMKKAGKLKVNFRRTAECIKRMKL